MLICVNSELNFKYFWFVKFGVEFQMIFGSFLIIAGYCIRSNAQLENLCKKIHSIWDAPTVVSGASIMSCKMAQEFGALHRVNE